MSWDNYKKTLSYDQTGLIHKPQKSALEISYVDMAF